MTIDERLEKLTERHEALTQSVELMLAESRERDKVWGTRFNSIMEGMESLLNIAEIHERRISKLEGQ